MFGLFQNKKFADYDELLMEYLLTGNDYLDIQHNELLFLEANNLPSIPSVCYWKVSEDAQEHIFNAIIGSSEILNHVKINQNLSGVRSLRTFPIYIMCDFFTNRIKQEKELEKVLEELVMSARGLWEYLMLFGNAKNKTQGVIDCIIRDIKNHAKIDIFKGEKNFLFKTNAVSTLETLVQNTNWMQNPHLKWFMHPSTCDAIEDVLKRRYPRGVPNNILVSSDYGRRLYDRNVAFSYEMPVLSDDPDCIIIIGDFARGSVAYCQPEQTTVSVQILNEGESPSGNAVADISSSSKVKRAIYCFNIAIEIEIVRPDMFKGIKVNGYSK